MNFKQKITEQASSPKTKETALKVGRLLNGFSAEEMQEVLGLVHNNFKLNCTFTFDGEED